MGLGTQDLTNEDVLIAIGLTLAAMVILLITWWSHSQALTERGGSSAADTHFSVPSETVGVIYDEVHWAFYRSGPIFWLSADYYTGSLWGLLLIGLEEALDPAVRNALKDPETSLTVITRWGIVLSMTTIFLLTRNLWMVIGLHWLIAAVSVLVKRAAGPISSP